MKKLILVALFLLPVSVTLADENFTQLRESFSQQEDFNPYTLQVVERTLVKEAMAEWKTGSAVKAINILKEVIKVYPYSIDGHRRLADAYKELLKHVSKPKNVKRIKLLEKKHRNKTNGIIKSIIVSGDGHTEKSAYKVITIPEEYMTLLFLGLRVKKQYKHSRKSINNNIIDIHETIDRNGNNRKVFFELMVK